MDKQNIHQEGEDGGTSSQGSEGASRHGATPQPWLRDGRCVYAVGSDQRHQPCNRFFLQVQGGWVDGSPTMLAEMEANAALIVRAVNCHDELVAALVEARRYFMENHPACIQIAAALAKAGA